MCECLKEIRSALPVGTKTTTSTPNTVYIMDLTLADNWGNTTAIFTDDIDRTLKLLDNLVLQLENHQNWYQPGQSNSCSVRVGLIMQRTFNEEKATKQISQLLSGETLKRALETQTAIEHLRQILVDHVFRQVVRIDCGQYCGQFGKVSERKHLKEAWFRSSIMDDAVATDLRWFAMAAKNIWGMAGLILVARSNCNVVSNICNVLLEQKRLCTTFITDVLLTRVATWDQALRISAEDMLSHLVTEDLSCIQGLVNQTEQEKIEETLKAFANTIADPLGLHIL